MNPDSEKLRHRTVRRLRTYFAHHRWPRIVMSGVLLLTGLAGFFSSFLLLRAGLEKMWIRYPLATLVAWFVFLGLMRAWAEFERRALPPECDPASLFAGADPGDPAEDKAEKESSFGDWLDCVPDFQSGFFDDDGGCALLLLILILGALLFASVAGLMTILFSAPLLIAEVFLDAVLVAALYKRVRGLDARWWLTGALRRTALPVLWTALLLMCAGFLMQALVPHAKSIGGVYRYWQEGRER